MIAPTPDGRPLVLAVECRTNRHASRGRPHEISIDQAWNVETPHDLEAERVAAAFGGYTSCLELVDEVIPAARTALGLLTRRAPTPMTRSRSGSRGAASSAVWEFGRVRGCRCWQAPFSVAQVAATHLRSPAHLSRKHGVSSRQLVRVLDALGEAWGPLERLPSEAAAARPHVREERGVEDLWLAGIHPAAIPGMARLVTRTDEALPASYFLGVTYAGSDPEWLSRVLSRTPDPDVATWLAWLSADCHGAVDNVDDWLDLGLGRTEVLALSQHGVPVEAAFALAAGTSRTPRAAARDLAGWAALGVRPTLEHLTLLDRASPDPSRRPSAAAVDRLCHLVEGVRPDVDRTELAVLLALEGTVGGAARRVEQGVTHAHQLFGGRRPLDPPATQAERGDR